MATTEDTFEKLEEMIFSNKVPSQSSLQDEDYDDLLDERDEDDFSKLWTKSYNAIDKIYKTSDLSNIYKKRIDKIREFIFKRVYKATESSNLSSYISDDFDLIMKALLIDSHDKWVNELWHTYANGQIPTGELQGMEGNLKDLI